MNAIYRLYNKELKGWSKPFFAIGDKEAVSMVRAALLYGSDAQLSLEPGAFQLHRIGRFDDIRGRIRDDRCLVCEVGNIPLPKNFDAKEAIKNAQVQYDSRLEQGRTQDEA